MAIGPVFDVVNPAVGDEPQIAVREEVFGHFLDFGVVCDFLFKQVLPGVVLFGIGDGVLEGLVDHDNFLGDFSVLIFLVVCVELGNGSAQRLDVVLELFLLCCQLLFELYFTGFVLFFLLFHLVQN